MGSSWLPKIGLALMLCGSCASLSAAELVYFRNGRTMTIEGHRMGTDRAILTLLGQGRLEVPVDWIQRVVPLPRESPPSEVQAVPVRPASPPPLSRGALDRVIRQVARRHGLDETLVRSIIRAESNFDPLAVSDKGASGLMQLMPATASAYRVKDVFDAEENIEAGVRYLKHLMGEFNRNLMLVLAAYNAGPSAVRNYQGIPPFAETREYIRRVLQFYRGHRRQPALSAGAARPLP